MSTKFTGEDQPSDLQQPLTVLLDSASQSVLKNLVMRLRERGYPQLTEPHLMLYGNLDCGATYAAQIAQRMQVSRQAISKTLRELQNLSYIRLEDDAQRRNQKQVIMTKRGMQLALSAREELKVIEAEIADQIGTEALAALRQALESGWGTGASS